MFFISQPLQAAQTRSGKRCPSIPAREVIPPGIWNVRSRGRSVDSRFNSRDKPVSGLSCQIRKLIPLTKTGRLSHTRHSALSLSLLFTGLRNAQTARRPASPARARPLTPNRHPFRHSDRAGNAQRRRECLPGCSARPPMHSLEGRIMVSCCTEPARPQERTKQMMHYAPKT